MDPNRQTESEPRAGARPTSIDGFFNKAQQPGGQIKIPHDPVTTGTPQPARQTADISKPAGGRPAPPPPSAAKRPFMPSGFYTPPTIPTLPKLEEAPPPTHAEKTRRNQGLRDILSVGGVLASALLLAFVLINFVFQSYQVEGPSMRTTLEDADHLIVWKVDRTIANITGGDYIPNRGDVIIFNEPAGAEPGAPAGKQLIKRVIGLPGDRVVIENTKLTVYNQENPDGFNPDQTLPYGDKIIFEKPSSVDVTVGDGQVFVAGDNRDNSLDSRLFGPIDNDIIVGKLAVRILPLNTFKLF